MNEVSCIVERKRKSVTNIEDAYDIERLQEQQYHFVSCTIELVGEYLTYTYKVSSLTCMDNIKQLPKLDILRLLIGVAVLQSLYNTYDFSLHPNNLYYSKDMVIKIKERDILIGEKTDYLEQYKSLIGSIFLKKYGYEDLVQGGLSLLKEDRGLVLIWEAENVSEIVAILEKWYEQERCCISKKVYVSRKGIKIQKVLLLMTTLLWIGISIFAWYQHFYVIVTKDMHLAANKAFMEKKYLEVQRVLEDQTIEALSKEESYMLAQAYIENSSLKKEDKKYALSLLTLKGNEEYTMFWIYLGSKDFDNVYKGVNYFNDERILSYAYQIELGSLIENTEMTLADKTERKEVLETWLEDYTNEIEDQEKKLVE
jgi:type VII secretion protein EssB